MLKKPKKLIAPEDYKYENPHDRVGFMKVWQEWHEQFGPSIVFRQIKGSESEILQCQVTGNGNEYGKSLLFANGAVAELVKNSHGTTELGFMSGPDSQTPIEVTENIIWYWKVRQVFAVDEFDTYRKRVMNDNTAYTDEQEHLATLKKLKAAVKQCHDLIMETELTLSKLKGTFRTWKQRMREMREEELEEIRLASFQEKVRKLQV